VPIGPDTTAGELHDLLATQGAGLMLSALAELERGALSCQPQPSAGATYAAKIDKGETRLDFTLPAREVHNRVRGLSPAPGAWLEIDHAGKVERVKVLRTQLAAGAESPGFVLDEALTIACGEGAVRVLEVQRSGKKPMSAGDFLRGFPLAPGTRLRGPG
jgi:methionyl-tRNA formyltransferase